MRIKITFLIVFVLSVACHAQKVQTSGQRWFEEYKQTGKEWQEERKQRNCADSIIQKYITRYNTESSYQEKWLALRELGEVSCQKTQKFLLQTALSDTSLKFRMLALQYLVWVDAKNAIPALLERSQEDLPDEEKLRIGRTILLLEDFRGTPIVNEICYRSTDPEICRECLSNIYDYTTRKESIKYYSFRLKNAKTESEQVAAANSLAMKDCYRKAIPVLRKTAKSEDSALRVRIAWGLGFIDSKASLDLLQDLAKDTGNKDLKREIKTAYERVNHHHSLKIARRKARSKAQSKSTDDTVEGIVPLSTSSVSTQNEVIFNHAAAVAYAKQWCNGFNTKPNGPYYDYTEYGGDCAAFVSQCLIAGGLDLSKGADGDGLGVKQDKVISGVEYLVRHLRDIQKFRHEESTDGAPEPDFVLAGDPVFRYPDASNHSLICIGKSGSVNQYACHTGGAYNCSSTRSIWGIKF